MRKAIISGLIAVFLLVVAMSIHIHSLPTEPTHDSCTEELHKLAERVEEIDTMLRQIQLRMRIERDKKYESKFAISPRPPVRILGDGYKDQKPF